MASETGHESRSESAAGERRSTRDGVRRLSEMHLCVVRRRRDGGYGRGLAASLAAA